MNKINLTEKLGPSDSMKTWIDDFIKSDAPQFKNMTKKEKIKAAIAAYYDAKRKSKKKDMKEETELNEAMRLLKSHNKGDHIAKVYYDSDSNEYRVKFFKNGIHNPKADYFTNDKEDAHGTAKYELNRMHNKSLEESTELNEKKYSHKAARAGKDIGEKGKNFEKIAKKAAKEYGSEESGKKVAGAVLKNIRKKHMKEDNDYDMNDVRDHEGEMILNQLMSISEKSARLAKMIDEDDQFEAWVQAKITKAEDYINSVCNYLSYDERKDNYMKPTMAPIAMKIIKTGNKY